MSRLSKHTIEKISIYVIPTVVIGLLAVLTFFLLVPKVREIIENNQLLEQKKVQLTRLERKRTLLDSVGSNLTQQLLVLAEQALPREKDAPSLLAAIDNLSAQTLFSVEHVDLNPGAVSTPSGVTAIPKTGVEVTSLRFGSPVLEVAIIGKGNTMQLLDFVKNLQISRRIMDIKNMKISYDVEVPDTVSANLSVNVYYLPAISEISQIDEDLPQISSAEQKLLENLSQMPYISIINLPQIPATQVQVRRNNLFSNE